MAKKATNKKLHKRRGGISRPGGTESVTSTGKGGPSKLPGAGGGSTGGGTVIIDVGGGVTIHVNPAIRSGLGSMGAMRARTRRR